MKSLKKLLKEKFSTKNRAQKTELDEKTVFFIFKKVVQEEFGTLGREKFSTQHFSNKTIFIKSNSSAWSSELWANQERIVSKINQELGEELVEKIKFN
jgi:predicted nucleic acid-binding Zn ribbon protein